MPSFEAAVLGMVSSGVEGNRGIHGVHRGDGVDQLRRFDLDVAATLRHGVPGYVLDEDGGLHTAEFTVDEDVALFVQHVPGADLSKLDVAWAAIEAKGNAWERRVAELLENAAPGVLISVVNVHV
jgi:hypothetical protein